MKNRKDKYPEGYIGLDNLVAVQAEINKIQAELTAICERFQHLEECCKKAGISLAGMVGKDVVVVSAELALMLLANLETEEYDDVEEEDPDDVP